jgi:hypothetical protein
MTTTGRAIGHHFAPTRVLRPLARLQLLLGVQTLVVLLVSLNRLSRLTLGYVADNEFLRWVDLNNMLVLPLLSILAFYLLKKEVEAGAWVMSTGRVLLNLAFVGGVYVLGASYGTHEVTNYLHARFCAEGAGSDLCRIVIFNDDAFSHWVFFTGFVLINGAMLGFQALYPSRARLRGWDVALLMVNGLFIGLGIFANLAFEAIGLDLYVVALLALLALGLLWRRGAQPLFIYYAFAYSVGLVATLIMGALG